MPDFPSKQHTRAGGQSGSGVNPEATQTIPQKKEGQSLLAMSSVGRVALCSTAHQTNTAMKRLVPVSVGKTVHPLKHADGIPEGAGQGSEAAGCLKDRG